MESAEAWPNHTAWTGAINSLRESSPLPSSLMAIFSNVSKAICTFRIGVKKQVRIRAYSESGN